MRLGQKKIFHLEAWVVKVMTLYKVRVSHHNIHATLIGSGVALDV
jgi:hypothetical protein